MPTSDAERRRAFDRIYAAQKFVRPAVSPLDDVLDPLLASGEFDVLLDDTRTDEWGAAIRTLRESLDHLGGTYASPNGLSGERAISTELTERLGIALTSTQEYRALLDALRDFESVGWVRSGDWDDAAVPFIFGTRDGSELLVLTSQTVVSESGLDGVALEAFTRVVAEYERHSMIVRTERNFLESGLDG